MTIPRRQNRGVATTAPITKVPTFGASRGSQQFAAWHWGLDPDRIVTWADKDYPTGDLIECGRLAELHIREPGKRTDTIIKLTKAEANASHLTFDPNHPNQRLYILCAPEFAARMKQQHRQNPNFHGGTRFKSMPLVDIADAVGGRHADGDYPNVIACPIGILTHFVYATEKKGDGFSFYIHKCGEESGICPALAVDEKGRCWIVGGQYTAPNAGVTD